VDVAGAAAVTAGLALAVFAIVRAPQEGWASPATLLVLALAVALLIGFLVIQRARRAPLVRLGIFRTPGLGSANLAQALLGAAWIPMWYFLNLYLQQVLGYGAFASGAALLPMTVLIVVLMVAVAPRLIAGLGAKPLIIGGLPRRRRHRRRRGRPHPADATIAGHRENTGLGGGKRRRARPVARYQAPRGRRAGIAGAVGAYSLVPQRVKVVLGMSRVSRRRPVVWAMRSSTVTGAW
jgi:hypothetical protein